MEKENSFFEILNCVLNGYDLSETQEYQLIVELKSILYYAAKIIGWSTLKNIYGNNIEEESFSDMIELILSKKEALIDKFSKDENGMKSYIRTMLINKIRDKLRKKSIYIDDNCSEQLNYSEDKYRDCILFDEIEDFTALLEVSLTSREKEALCLENAGIKPSNWTKSSFEKAKSRAKSRMKAVVDKEGFSLNAVEESLKRLDMSDMCKKIVNNYKRQKNNE